MSKLSKRLRTFPFILAALAVFALITVSATYAQVTPPKSKLSVSSATGAPGQTGVEVAVTLENDISIDSLTFYIKYTPGDITATDVIRGGDIPTGWVFFGVPAFMGQQGVIKILLATGNAERALIKGRLATVTFDIALNAADGVIPLRLDVDEGDTDGAIGEVQTVDGSIIVKGTSQETNKAPVVNAGVDFSLTSPEANAILQGSVIDDGLPAGGELKIFWDQINGPAQVVFANVNDPKTVATFPEPGTYTLLLKAEDGELSGEDEVVVTVTTGPAPTPTPTPTPDEARLSVGEVPGAPGSLVNVPVFLGGEDIVAFAVTIEVRGDVVVEEVLKGPGLPEGWNLDFNILNDNTVKITGYNSMNSFDYEISAFSVVVRVGEANPGDVIPVKATYVRVGGADEKARKTSIQDGKISIVMYGDVDGNGKFDIFDIHATIRIVLEKDIMPKDGSTTFFAANVNNELDNGTQVVDILDVATMYLVLKGEAEKFPVEG